MIYFIIIITRENDNNNKEYCSCEVTEQLQISEDINNMTDKKNGREYLGYVLEKLKERITEISLSLVEGQKEIEGMHEYYWENYTEMDQYGYENYDNQQALFRQISANEEQLILKQRFRRMADSPFFGRVDFIYEGEDEPEIFYIGIGNFAEKAGHIPLVYDWRAPVSGLFYDYDKGPASYEAPMGEIHGEVASKWQYKIRNGKMIYEFESDVKIDDEILKAELGSNGEVQLKNIIRTIQKEQNAIIRYPDVPVLLVNGIAGSGKTSVLLQRIAFMFFHQRTTLKPEDVYLITLNPVFTQYIDNVLPDLGERNPNTLTWTEFLQLVHDPIPDPGVETTAESLRRIDEALQSFSFEEEDLVPIDQKGKPVLGTEKILEALRAHEGKLPAGVRLIQVTVDELLEEARRALRSKKNSDKDDEDGEELLDGAEDAAEESVSGSPLDGRMDVKEENRIQNNYGGAFKMIRECGWLNLDHIGQRILGTKKLTSIQWLYLKMALTGECDRTAKYVCIDEVQDYTEAQLMIFERYFVNAKFMLLGDEFQSIREGNIAFQDIHRLFEEKGKKTVELPLQTSYRSSPEITALFAGLLPEEKKLEAQSVQRPGVEPEICVTASEEEWKEKLLASIRENEGKPGVTAVICAGRKELDRIRKELGDKAPAAVSKDEPVPAGGSILISLQYAKGLEFDHVILPNADPENYPEGTLSRHRLYTAISRATQNITILAKKELSPLLG